MYKIVTLTREWQADAHVGQKPIWRVPDEWQGQRWRYRKPGTGWQGQAAIRGDPQQTFLPRVWRVLLLANAIIVVCAGNIVLEPQPQ